MKKMFVAVLSFAAILVSSCKGTDESTEVEVVETVEMKEITYSLDTNETSLWWKGEENEMHFHTGYVQVSEGSLTMIGDSVSSGSFTIDLNKITVADSMEQGKIENLIGHLQGADFFSTTEYPAANVSVNGYNDGKMNTTINVLGVDLQNEIPLAMEASEDMIKFSGTFGIDFADTKMPYITNVNPETGAAGAKSEFQFELNLVMRK